MRNLVITEARLSIQHGMYVVCRRQNENSKRQITRNTFPFIHVFISICVIFCRNVCSNLMGGVCTAVTAEIANDEDDKLKLQYLRARAHAH